MKLKIVIEEIPTNSPMDMFLNIRTLPIDLDIESIDCARIPQEQSGWMKVGLRGQAIIIALYCIPEVHQIYLTHDEVSIEFSTARNAELDERVRAALSIAMGAEVSIRLADLNLLGNCQDDPSVIQASIFDTDWLNAFGVSA